MAVTITTYYQKVADSLAYHRFFFMGLAILAVILYHCYCAIPEIHLLKLFKRGYVGVDVFFLFSGLGCAFSFSKNGWRVYIKNRFTKIIPLFVVWAIVHLTFVCIRDCSSPTIIDVIGLFTTMSYYGIGTIRSNWYLSAILLLYLLLPMFYHITKRIHILFPTVLYMATLFLLLKINLPWYYDVFVSRIPVFVLGVELYFFVLLLCPLKKKGNCACMNFLCVCMFVIGAFFLPRLPFISTSLMCPLIVLLLSMLPEKIMCASVFSYLGKHSLEFFIANCWTMLIMGIISCDIYLKCAQYFLLNAVLSYPLILLNTFIKTRFNAKNLNNNTDLQ